MGRLISYAKFLKKIDIMRFFRLNYMCKNVIRMDKSKIIPYKHSVIELDHGAKIYLSGGDIEIGCSSFKKINEETKIRIAKNSIWSSTGGCKISYGSTIEVLKNAIFETGYFTMNSNSVIVSDNRISLGNDVMISRNVVIYDSDFHSILDDGDRCINKSEKVVIEDHVWLAANVTVLKGAYIGEGSIIGANTIVTENVPEQCILQNICTKKIKKLEGKWDRKKPEKME